MTTESMDTGFLTLISGARSDKRRWVSEVMAKVREGYFGNTPDKQLAAAMDDMFDDILETLGAEAAPSKETSHIGRMAEGYPLFGLGESGTRKSSTFARMIHIRPEFAGFSYAPHENRSALISVKAPSPCTLRVLGVTIARAMGLPTNDSMKENAVWDDIMDNLPRRGIRVIHIDEFQHVLENRNKLDIAKIRNTLKRVLQTPGHPVWMLITGMPECGPVLEGDLQTWRRKSHVFFQKLDFSAHAGKCRTMVEFFAGEKAGLECKAFTTDENIHRLMHASLFRLGVAIDIVVKSIRVALQAEDSELKLNHFAKAYRTLAGCADTENPFLSEQDFTKIEVGKYLTRMLEHGRAAAGTKAVEK
jgi:hypothetical protein